MFRTIYREMTQPIPSVTGMAIAVTTFASRLLPLTNPSSILDAGNGAAATSPAVPVLVLACALAKPQLSNIPWLEVRMLILKLYHNH